MQYQLYPVLIRLGEEAKKYSADFQTKPEYAAGWKAVLKRAHGKAEVACMCPGRGAKRLSIHYVSNTDSFYISRYPESGHEHAPECKYYAPDPEKSGIGCYDKDAIEELPDGGLKIKLQVGLEERTPGERDEKNKDAARPRDPGTRTRKPAMTLLGLLHLLWTQARLNWWYPKMEGKLNLNSVMYWLRSAAGPIRAGRVGLADVLCLAADKEHTDQAKINQEVVRKAAQKKRRLIVIAPLALHSAERERCEVGHLPIYGFHGIPRLALDAGLWSRTVERFGQEIAAWRNGYRTIAIVQTDTPEKQTGKILDMALMTVSKAWIPLDSMLEGTVEEKLRAERRSFEKPLRFDAAEEVVFPDFWLADVGRDFPMEVFGRNDPAYEARKHAKVRYYDQTYGATGWWHWDAAADPDRIPDLPEPVKSFAAATSAGSFTRTSSPSL